MYNTNVNEKWIFASSAKALRVAASRRIPTEHVLPVEEVRTEYSVHPHLILLPVYYDDESDDYRPSTEHGSLLLGRGPGGARVVFVVDYLTCLLRFHTWMAPSSSSFQHRPPTFNHCFSATLLPRVRHARHYISSPHTLHNHTTTHCTCQTNPPPTAHNPPRTRGG